jgi:hypothetical protein
LELTAETAPPTEITKEREREDGGDDNVNDYNKSTLYYNTSQCMSLEEKGRGERLEQECGV